MSDKIGSPVSRGGSRTINYYQSSGQWCSERKEDRIAHEKGYWCLGKGEKSRNNALGSLNN